MESRSEPDVKMIPSNVGVHTFSTTIADKLVKFEVLKFKDSVFIWVGEKHNRILNDLSLAVLARNQKEAVCTKIMGPPTDLTSNNLANKLSKKLGKSVYVSFNLVDDRLTVPVISNRITEEVNNHPQYF